MKSPRDTSLKNDPEGTNDAPSTAKYPSFASNGKLIEIGSKVRTPTGMVATVLQRTEVDRWLVRYDSTPDWQRGAKSSREANLVELKSNNLEVV